MAYFGEAPFWMPAFFVSCRANPDVHWFIYTDTTMDGAPPNVTIKPLTVEQIGERVSAVMGRRITVRRTINKVNDFKPLYGLMFADDLRGFDFWGYSDLDIVWGDIRRFITDDVLRDHDIISSRSRKVSGHFALFRNSDPTNRAYELIPDVEEAMASATHLHLDEREMTRYLRETIASAPPDAWPRVYWPDEISTSGKYQRSLDDADTFWWRSGRTFGPDGHEFMYVHFNKMKRYMRGINFGAGDSPTTFGINRRGITA